MENKQQDETSWDNFTSFISDLAQNNEMLSQIPDTHAEEIQTISLSGKKNITQKLTSSTASIKSQHSGKRDQIDSTLSGISTEYGNLKGELNNLLLELKEIKKARQNLQKKISDLNF